MTFSRLPRRLPPFNGFGALMRPYAGRADAHFYLGLVADAQGENQEAVSQYQAALKNNPNDSKRLRQARPHTGQSREARCGGRVSCESRSQLDPIEYRRPFQPGCCPDAAGELQPGLKELAEVLRLHPHDAATHFAWGSRTCTPRESMRPLPASARGCATSRMTPRPTMVWAPRYPSSTSGKTPWRNCAKRCGSSPNYPEAQQLLPSTRALNEDRT